MLVLTLVVGGAIMAGRPENWVRLVCGDCGRCDNDGITEERLAELKAGGGWGGIAMVRTWEEVSVNSLGTHVGTCPVCAEEDVDADFWDDDDDDDEFDDDDFDDEFDDDDDTPDDEDDGFEDDLYEADVPAADDLVTSDYRQFWRYAAGDVGLPVLVVPGGGDWESCVSAFMDENKCWPDVWLCDDCGEWVHIGFNIYRF